MKTNFLIGMVATVLLLAAGCNTTAKGPGASPEGIEWTLTELDGQPVAPAEGLRVPTLKLDAAAKRASGTGGINRFSGGYELDGAKLKFGMLMSTKMGGSPEAMARETAFLSAMQKVSSWKSDAKILELNDGETTLLKFAAR